MSKTRAEYVRCLVVTPESTVLDQVVQFVSFTAEDGEIGIYPSRTPIVAKLRPGELRLRTAEKTEHVFVDGGFAQLKNDVLTILTPRAQKRDQLESAAIETEFKKTAAEIPTSDSALEERLRRLDRIRAQLRLARTKR